MKRLPQRTSLVAQTVEVLSEAIAGGQWPRWLPGELELSRRLHVSRVTLRAALAELERQGVVAGGQGKRRGVVMKKPGSVQTPKRAAVVLLTPRPLHRLSTAAIFWMDELREHLSAAGWPLEIHESPAAFRRRPVHALEELANRLSPSAWVLYRSTPEMQKWFHDHHLATVVAGSVHPGLDLSSVDLDHAACCRHAAGRFLAAGHTRLAVIRPDTNLAGDLESVGGFREGAGAEPDSVVHDGSVKGICQGLERLFAGPRPPTGLFIFHTAHFITTLGWLHRRGIRVPEEVSLVCRDDDPVMDHVLPAPTRYSLKPENFARKLTRLVSSLVAGATAGAKRQRIMPDFVKGASLARLTS